MTSGLLSAELAATCNALGYYDGQKYHLEPHSKETIKDVIRYLRRDEDSHDIRRFIGNTKLLQTDLLPILQCHAKDKELFDVVLRLIVNLTTPALIIYNEVIPKEKLDLNQYLQLVSHLQNYKEAFIDHKIWDVLTEHLSILLNKEPEDRDEDDQRTVERILILVRNVLHVPADASSDWRPDNDASSHDQLIWALHQSGMLDLLLYMASSSNEATFFMHLLEIICLMVREQPAALLAETASQRSKDEKHRDEEELLKIRQKEMQIKASKSKFYLGARHSRFGGTFVIKNMKSTSDRDLIYHKPLHKVNSFTLDDEKKPKKIPKNRMPLKCDNPERRSALSVRLILKQFCVEILNAAYNPLMKHVKDCLVRGKTQNNDESFYFTALKFFMEFNRKYKFQVKLVSETMSVETFYFVQKYLETWHEMMITDKAKIALWSTRMHIALKAYKELLQNLMAMDVSPEETVRESSKIIKSNVFYVIEYREMLLMLINTYKKSKYSHQYLIDLVETVHIFLKLLQKFCDNKKMVVQKQVRRSKSQKKKQSKKKDEGLVKATEELWPQVKLELEKAYFSPINKEVIPFDAASAKDIEEQKIDAMKRIQILLKSGEFEESIALLRASRDVWPENNCFGNKEMSQEEELECMKEVFFADLDVSDLKNGEIDNDKEEEVFSDEEENSYQPIAEQSFNIQDLVKRFASPKVMSVCITLLSTFEKNSQFTNHCIVKMLHRIAWDCKLPSMLFQASLFRRFQQIIKSKDPNHKELIKLAIYILRKFTEVAATNKKILMELLFFKTAKEAYEIECGYGSYQEKSKAAALSWHEHEEDELRRLHEEYMKTKPSEEIVDWIMDNIINKDRSKRSVKKKMKELGLIEEVKKPVWEEHEEEELKSLHAKFIADDESGDLIYWIMNNFSNKSYSKRSIKKKMRELGLDLMENEKVTKWSEEQEEEIKSLFEEFKYSEDPLSDILERLSVKRSRRNVASTLVRLGVIDSTKVLRKKRQKQSSRKKQPKDDESESESSSSSEDETVHHETREEIRAKELIPELMDTTSMICRQKEIDTYLKDGLEWVNQSMNDCVEDIGDSDEPTEVPLLPLSNEAMLSIENKSFQNFLLSLGIFRPLQQEVYWRFPSDWKEADFRKRQNLINLIIENDAFDEHIDDVTKLVREIAGNDLRTKKLDEKKNQTGSRSVKINKLKQLRKKITKASDDADDRMQTSKADCQDKLMRSSDSEDSHDSIQRNNAALRGKAMRSSDSEDDHDNMQRSREALREKLMRSSDSEDYDESVQKNKAALRKKLVSSDSEDDRDSVQKNKVGKRIRNESDSDDIPNTEEFDQIVAQQRQEILTSAYKQNNTVSSKSSDQDEGILLKNSLNSESEDEMSINKTLSIKKSRILSESESEESNITTNGNIKNKTVSSDHEENIDSGNDAEKISKPLSSENKRARLSDSDSEEQRFTSEKKKRYIIPSDDDDDVDI